MKNSATDSLASISSVSNSRFALSYSTSSDAFAIFVRARQASEIDPIRITIFNNSCSFSKALVSDCQAFSEMSTSLGSCTLSNSARGVPEVLTIISESSAESQPLIEAHVRKRCKKVGTTSQFWDGRRHKHTDTPGRGCCSLHWRRRRCCAASPLHVFSEFEVEFLFGEIFISSLVQEFPRELLHLELS